MSFWPQTLVDWAQIISATGTLSAVVVSLWLSNRGVQTKIEASCKIQQGISAPKIKVSFRNIGRDSTYMVGIGGTASDRSETLIRFSTSGDHINLPPGAPENVILEKYETVTAGAVGIAKQFSRLWLEDVSGKRFHVKGSEKILRELWSEMYDPPTQSNADNYIPH